MANAKGHRQTVNHLVNQFSHISLSHADGNRFYPGQTLTATGSDGSKYDDAKIVQVSNDKKRAVARLKCTLAGRGHYGDLPPDGQLTVTLTGGPTVDPPIDVTYVDDVP